MQYRREPGDGLINGRLGKCVRDLCAIDDVQVEGRCAIFTIDGENLEVFLLSVAEEEEEECAKGSGWMG
jgi:hypothetical protein